MKQSDFEQLDTSLAAYLEARARLNSAQQALWGSIIPLITDAIVSACSRKDFASRAHIVEYVNREVNEYYKSADMQSRLPHGRRTHDGEVAFVVDTQSTMVIDAIKWAVICEVIQEVVEGKYALPEPKRA